MIIWLVMGLNCIVLYLICPMMWTQDNLACHGIELYSTLSDLSYDVNSPKTEQMNPESLYSEKNLINQTFQCSILLYPKSQVWPSWIWKSELAITVDCSCFYKDANNTMLQWGWIWCQDPSPLRTSRPCNFPYSAPSHLRSLKQSLLYYVR